MRLPFHISYLSQVSLCAYLSLSGDFQHVVLLTCFFSSLSLGCLVSQQLLSLLIGKMPLHGFPLCLHLCPCCIM